ncbi:MAG TPA: hypothetical protein PKK31_08070 [Elusimicrobiales bacterium]|nr:hypothetical protein [Elusimicrobiales bacterium]
MKQFGLVLLAVALACPAPVLAKKKPAAAPKAAKTRVEAAAAPAAAKAQAEAPAAPAAAETPTEAPVLPAVETQAEVPAAAEQAPAPVPAAKPAFRSACQYCFQPLLDGYAGLIEELKPWLAELETSAADFEATLSGIQKEIDAKDAAISAAKEGADKKAVKAEVKKLTADRKVLLKKYVSVSDEKEKFYKRYSKEVAKRIEAQIGKVQQMLRQVQSAASSQG